MLWNNTKYDSLWQVVSLCIWYTSRANLRSQLSFVKHFDLIAFKSIQLLRYYHLHLSCRCLPHFIEIHPVTIILNVYNKPQKPSNLAGCKVWKMTCTSCFILVYMHFYLHALKCSQCNLWVHKRCSGIQGRIVANPIYVCPRCRGQTRPIDGRPVTQVDVDGTWCWSQLLLSWWHVESWRPLLSRHYNQVLYCLGKVQEAPANPDIQAHIRHSSWEGV